MLVPISQAGVRITRITQQKTLRTVFGMLSIHYTLAISRSNNNNMTCVATAITQELIVLSTGVPSLNHRLALVDAGFIQQIN